LCGSTARTSRTRRCAPLPTPRSLHFLAAAPGCGGAIDVVAAASRSRQHVKEERRRHEESSISRAAETFRLVDGAVAKKPTLAVDLAQTGLAH
jgi:hypothetical protein